MEFRFIILKTILVLTAIVSSHQSACQSRTVDSLERVLAKHPDPTKERVDALNVLGHEIFQNNKTRCRQLVKEAKEISQKLDYPKGMAWALWIESITSRLADRDSLINAAWQASEQSKDEQIKSYLLQAFALREQKRGKRSEADSLFDQAYQIALKNNDLTMQSNILCNRENSDNNKRIKNLLLAVEVAKESNNPRILNKAYNKIANTYYNNYDRVRAAKYYMLAINLSEYENNTYDLLSSLLELGGVQVSAENYNDAIKTLERAYDKAKQINDSTRMSVARLNMGFICSKTGNPDALKYYIESFNIENGELVSKDIYTLTRIGEAYLEQGKTDEALINLEKAQSLVEQYKVISSKPIVDIVLGRFYFNQKQYDQAIKHTTSTIELSERFRLLEQLRDGHEQMAQISAATGNFSQAYDNQIKYQLYKDSLLNKEIIEKIAVLENSYQYEKEKQQYEIEQLSNQTKIKEQRMVISILIIVTLLIILLSWMIYRSNKLKKRLVEIELESKEREIEASQKELASATLKLIQSTESDAYCIKVLDQIEQESDEDKRQEIRSLTNYYKNKSHLTNWDEFELLFAKVNSEFHTALNEHFPNLTINERKLCVFIKLNMSNKDIANITLQSEEALKKARLRLRKKLDLERSTNLSTFINSL